MEIKNILVDIDIDAPSAALVQCGIDLATRFGANLVGVSAAQPSAARVGLDGAVLASAWYAEERARAEQGLKAAEDKFLSLVPKDIKHGFRGFLDNPNTALATMAHRADLILVGHEVGQQPDHQRHVDLGELVLAAGRPVLVAGSGVLQIWADKIVIAWKDTREARRAVSDALPFLKAASEVLIVVVDEGDYNSERQSLDDLSQWLDSHGVATRNKVLALHNGLAATIAGAADTIGADLVVSGGYGHSRFREWLFGGMTRELLGETTLNRFLSN
jgi:nucleotide-binding universal stress UspA family protein